MIDGSEVLPEQRPTVIVTTPEGAPLTTPDGVPVTAPAPRPARASAIEAPPAVVAPAAVPLAAPGRTDVRAVLVVDEDDDILASMAFLLRTWGHVALPAHSANEARQAAQTHEGRLHAALIDFHLASNENGLAVAALLRELAGADLPVAIVTGDTTPEVIAAVHAARLELLHKPASADAVQAFISRARAAT